MTGDLHQRVDPTLGPYQGKRLVDLAIVAVVAVPAAFLGVLAAVAVATTSRGPVLFRQTRVGLQGHPFTIVKFRTMTHDPHPTTVGVEAITRVGSWLRRYSLDELPQLINVVRGEMSIVGPRPTMAYQAAQWTDAQANRVAVRPGLTGLAQVSGRNALSWPQRIELDLRYVERQSITTDLAIVIRTAAVLLTGAGSELTASDDPLASGPEPDPERQPDQDHDGKAHGRDNHR